MVIFVLRSIYSKWKSVLNSIKNLHIHYFSTSLLKLHALMRINTEIYCMIRGTERLIIRIHKRINGTGGIEYE